MTSSPPLMPRSGTPGEPAALAGRGALGADADGTQRPIDPFQLPATASGPVAPATTASRHPRAWRPWMIAAVAGVIVLVVGATAWALGGDNNPEPTTIVTPSPSPAHVARFVGAHPLCDQVNPAPFGAVAGKVGARASSQGSSEGVQTFTCTARLDNAAKADKDKKAINLRVDVALHPTPDAAASSMETARLAGSETAGTVIAPTAGLGEAGLAITRVAGKPPQQTLTYILVVREGEALFTVTVVAARRDKAWGSQDIPRPSHQLITVVMDKLRKR